MIKGIRLRTHILLALILLILFWGVSMSLYQFFVVRKYIIGEAQREVRGKLKTVRTVYQDYQRRMETAFSLIDAGADIQELKENLHLDYLYWIEPQAAATAPSDLVREVVKGGRALGATRVMTSGELAGRHGDYAIAIKKTPMARPSDLKVLDQALSLEYARPYFDSQGRMTKVLCGGWVINRNFLLIDRIIDAVFEREMYESKPVGTVTIFQDDVRVATNVLDEQGRRAIGTRVSAEVYDLVVRQGKNWVDRAFVVTDWYLTAYEPIRDIQGRIIGILYVGILEKPFDAIRDKMFFSLLTILLLTGLPMVGISVLLANAVTKPLTAMARQIDKISRGDLKNKLDDGAAVREVRVLAMAFNDMFDRLAEREQNLAVSNEKLAVLNKRYLDLIGFVSHELKGILSSIVLNTYLLQKKIPGPVTEKQERILRSMARNLDYLTVTVKNFLNLSRIEKDEMKIDKQDLRVKEHIIDSAVETFKQQAEEKNITIQCDVPETLTAYADAGLMQIVINNLLSNAVKYGREGGEIRVRCQKNTSGVEISVYNDGTPIAKSDLDKLFKKFSRVVYRGMEKVKGTGIGLFITREIVERHGGTITVEPGLEGNLFRFTIPSANINA